MLLSECREAEPLTVALIIVGIAVVCLIGYMVWLAEKKRREAMAALAQRLNWIFDSSRDRDHDEQYAHFEIFRRGHSRCAYNTLTGEVEIDGRRWPAKMGDFNYKVTRRGRDKSFQ